jgi:Asp-tRNA(Asn)/Glu-tRNA(Gln) amidotransferase A subunit family amidase
MNTELLSATELVALIRDRQVGSLELLDAQLGRIDAHNGAINAVVAMDIEGARAAARAADDAPPDRRSRSRTPGRSRGCPRHAASRTSPTTCRRATRRR